MKKYTLLLFVSLVSLLTTGQNDTLKLKLDSIMKEANRLYCYEKAAWISTDMVMEDKKLKKEFGGYLIYYSNDTLVAAFINKDQNGVIAKYYFNNSDLNHPFGKVIDDMSISKTEQELIDIELKISNQLSDDKYEISFPSGFSPNFDLIKENDGFKLYIIMGTSEPGIIPFGNDYLIRTDLDGNITSWRKFHSRMIPAQSKGPNGEKVISALHSHLKTTPYITATDICTFKLYARYCDMTEFTVLCTATGKYYKYNLETDSIEVEEK
jgi:hypothetical protein